MCVFYLRQGPLAYVFAILRVTVCVCMQAATEREKQEAASERELQKAKKELSGEHSARDNCSHHFQPVSLCQTSPPREQEWESGDLKQT